MRWQKLTGWEDSPGVGPGTVPRAGAHGAVPGRLLAQPRTITVDGVVLRTPPGAMTTAVRELGVHLAFRDDELPLVARLDDAPPLPAYARCLRHSVPVDTGYRIGTIPGGAMQFEAGDPRRYSLSEERAEI
ncbi:hypothetical protein GCM10010211_28830 [Streptomyces albospinus]|uniref:Uncharacterized protein n=1 Tax=Streptomyces albospinus TaxID=285515 RepID=A0ABQ2V2R3_9ACTN|nr:hypothetical protein [Streptomyces albospinus]GGU62038.1 hypothetical protein GCM10010211_28830 [Streptomyces albospinus]